MQRVPHRRFVHRRAEAPRRERGRTGSDLRDARHDWPVPHHAAPGIEQPPAVLPRRERRDAGRRRAALRRDVRPRARDRSGRRSGVVPAELVMRLAFLGGLPLPLGTFSDPLMGVEVRDARAAHGGTRREHLLALVRSGDRTAFGTLMRRQSACLPHRPGDPGRRCRGGGRRAGSMGLAYRHLHQFEGRSSFSSWIGRIVSREALARASATPRAVG